MNSKFHSLFLSDIVITDEEINYKEKGKSARILVPDIWQFDVVEGKPSHHGYIKIIENGIEHIVHFMPMHNKDMREWQHRLCFFNQTEPEHVNEIESDYRRPLDSPVLKIQINEAGIRYSLFGKEEMIEADKIKGVSFEKAKGLSLGELNIQTTKDLMKLQTPALFNEPLSQWVNDVEVGMYKTKPVMDMEKKAYRQSQKKKNEVLQRTVEKQQSGMDEGTFGHWDKHIHSDYEQVKRILDGEKTVGQIIYMDETIP